MSNYRRANIEGGLFFFTVVLADRSSCLLVEGISLPAGTSSRAGFLGASMRGRDRKEVYAPSAVIARSERDEAIQGSHNAAGSLRYRSR